MARMYIFVLLILFDLYLVGVIGNENTGCSFKKDGCTYNILLQHPDDENVQRSRKDCGGDDLAKVINLDRAQNDYSAKIDDMEKTFSFLKDAHESRIKELEGTVHELLGISSGGVRNSISFDDRKASRKSTGDQALLNNDILMEKLEVEFGKLREEIMQKSEELIDTKIKLNETNNRMHESQLQHFKTSKELVRMENQLITMTRERAILKNQLKDKSYRLDISSKKATKCETKAAQQEDRVLELFRSESTLKEDLMTAEWNMNKTRASHDKMKRKHRELKARHERVKVVMKIREKELIDCYSAKTSTFCGFEDPQICGFTHIKDTSDFFDWTRGQGRTPSGRTGPDQDHTCQGPNGHYMFIEASSKAKNSNAILYSPLYRGMKEQCVEFYYHMNGRDMGTLNVYAQARGDVLNAAWRAYGNQGNVWSRSRLAIPKELARAGYQIAFEGITQNGYMGDMAIDDVKVTDGACPDDDQVVRVKLSLNSTSVIQKSKAFAKKIKKRKKNRRTKKPSS